MSQFRAKRRGFLAKTLIIPAALSSIMSLEWGGESLLHSPVAHAMTENSHIINTPTMGTIRWICTAQPDWQWLSGAEGSPGFPVQNDTTREGTIILPPQENYWYLCISLVLQGVTIGNAYLRYFQQNGTDVVQAMTVSQGQWIAQGSIDPNVSLTSTQGGINLFAELI